MSKTKLSREAAAGIEIGHTRISRRAQLIFSGLFLLFIFIYPAVEIAGGLPVWQLGPRLVAAAPSEYSAVIKSFETELENASLLRKHLLAPVTEGMVRIFSAGNEKVIVGADGWLFYSGDFNYLANPGFLRPERLKRRAVNAGVQPDPRLALLDFDSRLAERGIKLILVPVPAKPMLYADKLGAADASVRQNPSWREFEAGLRAAGLTVIDLASEFARMRSAGVEPYLRTDTHWSPEGMEHAARLIAGAVGAVKTGGGAAVEITNSGDIAAMLTPDEPAKLFPAETVAIIPSPEFSAASGSDVLLLGDSFTNIYHAPEMKWGMAAGLPERLSAYLGAPVDVIARNDAGAYAARELLARELRRGVDRLAGKKVVIYEFAIRELADGNWKILDYEVGAADHGEFLNVDAPRKVTATVAEISIAATPNAAPYRDHLRSAHLIGIDGGDMQALVYVVGMIDNKLTAAGRWKAGDTVEVTLLPAFDGEEKYGSWSRSELDDEELMLQEPLFGEIE